MRMIGSNTRWLLLLLIMIVPACAGPGGNLTEQPAGLLTADISSDAYLKKLAVLPASLPGAPAGRQELGTYLEKLIETIRAKGPELILVAPGADELSVFGSSYQGSRMAVADNAALAAAARSRGYQGVLVAGRSAVAATSERTGLLWFRKLRHYALFNVQLDLYDPYTGAKLLSRVAERKTSISVDEADILKAGGLLSGGPVEEELEEIAEDLGSEVVEKLEDVPWQVAVGEVEQSLALLPAGRREGIEVGDRLAVFKIGRVIAGVGSERFAMPSERSGELRVVEVGERTSRAAFEGEGSVKAGDIAVPVKTKP